MTESLKKQLGAQLGDQEADVLRYIDQNEPITLREVVDGYGTPHNLARTTIQTVMDRLRRKGYLTREKEQHTSPALKAREDVYVYRTARDTSSVMSDLVRGFVDKTLAGSLTPIVEYLIDSKGLSDDEATRLRSLIDD